MVALMKIMRPPVGREELDAEARRCGSVALRVL